MNREIIRMSSKKVAFAAAKAAAEELGFAPFDEVAKNPRYFKGENGSVSVLRDGSNYAVLIRQK